MWWMHHWNGTEGVRKYGRVVIRIMMTIMGLRWVMRRFIMRRGWMLVDVTVGGYGGSRHESGRWFRRTVIDMGRR